MTAARDILALCRAKGVTIATAESCTGGMVAAALTDPAGASTVMREGIVAYCNSAKIRLLDVRPATLEAHGAVSEEVAREMADGCRMRADAVLAVSVTGIAGPGGSEFKPEGRVCFAVAARSRQTISETVEFGAIGRINVRKSARNHALALLFQTAQKMQH